MKHWNRSQDNKIILHWIDSVNLECQRDRRGRLPPLDTRAHTQTQKQHMEKTTHMISVFRRLVSTQGASKSADTESLIAAVRNLKTLLTPGDDLKAVNYKSLEVSSALHSIMSRSHLLHDCVFSLVPILRQLRQPSLAWRLVAVIEEQMDHASVEELSSVAYCLAKLKVSDAAVWKSIRRRFLSLPSNQCPSKYFSRAIWGICNAHTPIPDLGTAELKTRLNRIDLDSLSPQDIVMILGSLCNLSPKDTPLLTNYAAKLSPTLPLPTCAIISLWKSVSRMQPPPPALVEFLFEQSRALRLDPDGFTDEACAHVAHAASVIKCEDARVMYQLIFFMKSKGLKVRAEPYLSLIKSFARLGIQDEVVWKRFATRLEKHGPGYSLKQLREIQRCFDKAGKLSQRLKGILQCFISLKEDHDRYGPS